MAVSFPRGGLEAWCAGAGKELHSAATVVRSIVQSPVWIGAKMNHSPFHLLVSADLLSFIHRAIVKKNRIEKEMKCLMK